MPSAKKVECGQRLDRGVLARSARRTVGYDEEEALYGEFPWHVSMDGKEGWAQNNSV